MFTRSQSLKYGAGAALSALGLSAQAAVPTGAEAIFTGLATDFGTVIGYGYVLMAVVTVGVIVLGMVSRIAKKSAK